MVETWITTLANGMFEASSISELGPLLLSSPAVSPAANGLAVLRLLNDDQFESLISIGSASDEGIEPLSMFDDHPVTQALRSGAISPGNIGKNKIYACPIHSHAQPVGVLIVSYHLDGPKPDILIENYPIVCSLVGGIFTSYFQRRSDSRSDPEGTEEFSSRQIQILQLITRGMTNEQVARTIMVSASTIRQENIKIFRQLGVSSRADAALRAIELGLISSDAKGTNFVE